MVYGLWLSRRRWRACLPLYLYQAFDTALHLASWAAPRYRLPGDALLLVFAWSVRRLGPRHHHVACASGRPAPYPRPGPQPKPCARNS